MTANIGSSGKPISNAMPVQGDGVVVVRPDGSCSFFTLGFDVEALKSAADRGVLTLDEEKQFDVLRKVMALNMAAHNEGLMNMLMEIAEHPDVQQVTFSGIKVS